MSADANSAFRKHFSSRRLIRPKLDYQYSSVLFNQLARDEHANSTTYSFETSTTTSNTPLPTPSFSSTSQNALPAGKWYDTRVEDVRGAWLKRGLEKLRIGEIVNDQVTPLRLAGHLSVLAVAAIILFLSQYDFPDLDISLRTIPSNALINMEAKSQNMRVAGAIDALTGNITINDDSLQPAAVPFTVVHEQPREEISLYRVKSGDTVLAIAASYGLSPETIQWSNPTIEMNPDLLQIGDELNILPVDGVLHTVVAGNTLASLASKYKVDVEDIVGYAGNGIEEIDASLVVGNELVVPGGVKPYVARSVVAYSGPIPASAAKGSGSFIWPASGSITQQFWGGHRAIDIGSWTGSSVKSSDSGYVVAAGDGWNSGYGNYVLVDHSNGFMTLYAHMNSIYVRPGESVSRGQQIGTVGNTGNSTGPHLHFEVRYQSVSYNPFNYLR